MKDTHSLEKFRADFVRVFIEDGLSEFVISAKGSSVIYSDKLLARSLKGVVKNRLIEQYEYTVFCFVCYFKIFRYEPKDFDVPFVWLAYEIDKLITKKDIDGLFFINRLLMAYPLLLEKLDKSILAKIERSIIYNASKKSRLTSNVLFTKKTLHVCICAGLVQHSFKALHLRMLINYASALLTYNDNIKVTIINTNEIPFQLLDNSFCGYRAKEDYLLALDKFVLPLLDLFPGRFEFINKRPSGIFFQKISELIDVINDIEPDIFMHFGSKNHNEAWFVRRIFYYFRPSVYFFSQMTNAVDEFNDAYFARTTEKIRGPHDPGKVVFAPNPIGQISLEEIEILHKYEDVKRENEFKIVSVLGGNRMIGYFKKYSENMFSRIFKLLSIENVTWTFIGITDIELLFDVHPMFKDLYKCGKINIIGVERNLLSYLTFCDLFLHLPLFTGGSGGVAMAKRVGLPILCFTNSDASVSLPKNSVFDKECIMEYFDYAEKLINDKDERLNLSNACREKYLFNPNVERVDNIMKGFEMAINNFNKRISNGA